MSRIILKLSGEALAGEKKTGFDLEIVERVARQVKKLVDDGNDVGIVIGGGNFWRGRTGTEIDRVKSDQIGMLATVMNCIYVSVVFFAGGTGHPYFSTDTGVVLRAIEVDADCILMAKNIDGVYDSDPAKNPDAKRFDVLPIQEIIDKNLQVIDMTASILARDNHMPLRIFDLNEEDSIIHAAGGAFNGTTVTVE